MQKTKKPKKIGTGKRTAKMWKNPCLRLEKWEGKCRPL
jgi:hypothetical protein